MAPVYFILWLTINGRVTAETVTLGILVSAALHLFSRRVLFVRPVSPASMLRLLPWGLLYLALLFIEIVKANLQVIRLVLSPVIEVEPCLIRFRTDLGSEAARVVLANSITLTPGTLTVSLEENDLLIHALDRNMAREVDESVFVRQLRRMEETTGTKRKKIKEAVSDA